MKQPKIRSLILWVPVISLFFLSNLSAQFAVPGSVSGNGGGSLAGSGYRIVGTVGQSVIGATFDDNYSLAFGFWQMTRKVATDIEQIPNDLQTRFRLDQNFPNPFRFSTTIRFVLPHPTSVALKLYDVEGREIATIINNVLPAGEHNVEFKAMGIAAGIYFYRLETPGFVQSRKLNLIK